ARNRKNWTVLKSMRHHRRTEDPPDLFRQKTREAKNTLAVQMQRIAEQLGPLQFVESMLVQQHHAGLRPQRSQRAGRIRWRQVRRQRRRAGQPDEDQLRAGAAIVVENPPEPVSMVCGTRARLPGLRLQQNGTDQISLRLRQS